MSLKLRQMTLNFPQMTLNLPQISPDLPNESVESVMDGEEEWDTPIDLIQRRNSYVAYHRAQADRAHRLWREAKIERERNELKRKAATNGLKQEADSLIPEQKEKETGQTQCFHPSVDAC